MGCGMSTHCWPRHLQDEDQTPTGVLPLEVSPSNHDLNPINDIAGPAGAVDDAYFAVFSNNAEQDSNAEQDDKDLHRLRERCPRFRILIIGKANAGKTTILQKFCGTTEKPIVRNKDGQVIDGDPNITRPTDGRGIHDLNNELTFSNNPNFVFHDSPGFEAASVKELEDVHEFITLRARTNELKDQLHAIWYCLPTDNARPLSNAEMSFFEQGTGKTPVIAIFTKYDGMILAEYNKLRFGQGLTKKEANDKAPGCADEVFQKSEFYLKRLEHVPFPPAKIMRVQDMQKPENNCAELSRQTLEALNSKRLQQLFVSVQQNNLGLSTEFALKNYVLDAVNKAADSSDLPAAVENMAEQILFCYNHLFRVENYDRRELLERLERQEQRERRLQRRQVLRVRLEVREETFTFFKSAFSFLAGQKQEPSFLFLWLGAVMLIVVEDSFWLKNAAGNTPGSQYQALKLALTNFQSSNRHFAVKAELEGIFQGATVQSFKGKLVEVVLGTLRKFQTNDSAINVSSF